MLRPTIQHRTVRPRDSGCLALLRSLNPRNRATVALASQTTNYTIFSISDRDKRLLTTMVAYTISKFGKR